MSWFARVFGRHRKVSGGITSNKPTRDSAAASALVTPASPGLAPTEGDGPSASKAALDASALKRAALTAACDGDLHAMRRLIDQGFEISGSLDSITGDTALHYASRHGREGMVSLLLKSGADVDASNKYGTPLTVACGEGNLAVIKLLIAAGANVNHRSAFSGDTPLHYACGSDSADAARMLLDHGADVNAANHSAETPLFEACKSRLDIVKLLVERGADIQRGNKNRQTALRFAEANDRNDIVRYLESQGIKQRAKVAVLVFLFEVTEPPRQDAEAICAPILRVHCPDDELGRAFVVGRMDRFSANVAMSVYLQYVMNRQLPDLGANFMIAELPSGEGLALLFRPA